MAKDTGLGDQALSKAAEIGLQSQLDDADELNVSIETNPMSLMGGEVDSVTVSGKNLVMQQELQAETLTVKTGSIKVNPWQAALGKIELERSTEAIAKIKLSEADINKAFNSQFVHTQIPTIVVDIDGQSAEVVAQEIKFSLPGNNRIALTANIKNVETNNVQQMSFTAVPKIVANGNRLKLEEIDYGDEAEISPDLTMAILKQVSDLLDMRNFAVPSLDLQLTELEVLAGHLVLVSEATVNAFPGNLD